MKDACDAHFHVFGPADKYPARDPKLRYKPPLAPLEDYLVHARAMGFERFVFVQPSAYGRDNRCMLDAMQETPHSRGIADVEENAPDAELARLHEIGVRGVRINVSPIHPPEAGLAATLYASHCTDDSPLFVATWYTVATALVTAIGAFIGSRVLRF